MLQTVGALTRASWYQARSYRLALLMQAFSILLVVVPTYFISRALQPTMAGPIAAESDQYFAFVLVGSIALTLVTTAMTALQGAIGGGIASGYFESLLMTRSTLPATLVGLSSYPVLITAIRAGAMLAAGAALGAQVVWQNSLPALLILALLVAAHWGFGLMAAALIVAFRTSGPIIQVVSLFSLLFGGVYYPVSVIPSWLGVVAQVTPLAYGLRAFRRVLLQGDGLGSVATDLLMVTSMGAVALVIGALSFQAALRYARRAGTLGAY